MDGNGIALPSSKEPASNGGCIDHISSHELCGPAVQDTLPRYDEADIEQTSDLFQPHVANYKRNRLAVVMVTYDSARHVRNALDSLLADLVTVSSQVIVVDNGSKDDTWAIVTGYPTVTAIQSGYNAGFSAACNVGIRAANADHVLLLNPDTVVPTNAIGFALSILGEDPRIGMVGLKLVQEDGTLDHACKRGFPTPWRSLAYLLKLHKVFPNSPRFSGYTAGTIDPDQPADVDAINGAFMLCRGEALKEVGLLDERFWMYGEDLDWCLRFWQAGWRVVYRPQASVIHLKGGSSGRLRNPRVSKAFHHAMLLFYDKHYRDRYPAVLRWGILFALGIRHSLALAHWYGQQARIALNATPTGGTR